MMRMTILAISDVLGKSGQYQTMRTMFLLIGVVFLILSIILFIKFDIRRNIFININNKQKNIPKTRMPKRQRGAVTERIRPQMDRTEKLSEETALLVEDSDKTEVLDESQLQFFVEKSVEMYSDEER